MKSKLAVAESELVARARLLEGAPVFDSLADAAQRSLSRRMRVRQIPAGELIDDPADEVVAIIADGQCTRTVKGADGNVMAVQSPAIGDLLITAATARGVAATATRALTACRLLVLDQDSLVASLGQEAGDVLLGLEKHLSERLRSLVERDAPHDRGELPGVGLTVAVLSPKGGAGTTTVAVNLAAALARDHAREVLLLDLSVPFCHAALFTDLVPVGSLASAGKAGSTFATELNSAVLNHASGLLVLMGANSPEESDLLTPELIAKGLGVLEGSVQLIVADLGSSLSESSLSVIERAAAVVLVVPPEIAALKDMRRVLDILTGVVGVAADRTFLVLNQRQLKSPLDRNAVETVLRRRVDVSIGHDGTKPEEATLRGEVQVNTDRASLVARGAEALASNLRSRLGVSRA